MSRVADVVDIHTADLEGAALNWAVAQCVDLPGGRDEVFYEKDPVAGPVTKVNDSTFESELASKCMIYDPAHRWGQGGPLVEEHVQMVQRTAGAMIDGRTGDWIACCQDGETMVGDTCLEACMRAIVSARIGDRVKVPSKLVM